MSPPPPPAAQFLRLALSHRAPGPEDGREAVAAAGRVIGGAGGADARHTIRSWAGYEPTPLLELPGLARALGVESVWCKDESGRFGIGSFKALGGAYAVLRALQDEIEGRAGTRPDVEALRRGHPIAATITATTASAGNHGRSVAWGSEQFGCRCVVVLPSDADPARAAAIEAHGATVVRFDGSYDEAVGHADRQAEENGWIVVSDTAYPGYEETPRRVMAGYTLLAEELLSSLAERDAPPLTHLFLQGGVGGLAAGLCGRLVERLGTARPRFVAVEPWRADCLGRSLRAGGAVHAEGPFETAMGGLAAGVASTLAWEVLATCLDGAVALPEAAWRTGAAALETGALGARILAGPSGAAGVGALLALARLPSASRLLGLGRTSRVGVLVTETRF